MPKESLRALANFEGEFVFTNKKAALDFSINFLELQTQHWGGKEAILRYYLLGKALKIALKRKIIKENDFYQDEEDSILNKLEKSRFSEIEKILKILKTSGLKGFKKTSGGRIYKKFRYANPKIIVEGKLIRLSKLDNNFKAVLAKHRNINKKGVTI